MLVFWKARLVLLSVPKTGTTALEAAFGPHADAAIHNPPGMKHMGVAKWRQQLAPVFERKGKRPLETMALMREPIDWLGSWWRYRQRPALDGQPNSTKDVSFDQFVDAWMRDESPPFASVGSQSRFLTGGVSHLFRYENIADATAFLGRRVGLQPEVGLQNVSPKRAVELSPDVEGRLRDAHADEFRLWESIRAT